MPIGNPIQKNNDTRVISATATTGQTDFTVTGGYTINAIGVFRNGVRLNNSTDFTAADGSTVSLNVACDAGDTVTFHIFDKFTVANAIIGAASTQTVFGNLTLNGELYADNFNPTNVDITGISTIAKAIIGTGVTIDQGNIDTVGIISATTFTGNVTGNLTGTASLITVADESSDATCFPTFVTAATGDLAPKSGTNLTFNSSTGALTATSVNGNIVGGTVSGTTGTFTGDVDIADKIVHTGDTNTAIRFPSADTITAETGGSERLRINSTGKVGIGTDSPAANLDFGAGSSNEATIRTSEAALILDINSARSLRVKTNGSERLRVTSGGKVLIGDDTSRLFDGSNYPSLQVSSSASNDWARISSTAYIDSTVGGGIILAKSRNGTVGSHTVVQDDDKLGSIFFEGSDGNTFERGAAIEAYVDGTPGDDDMPGRLVFRTSGDGTSTIAERMSILSDGKVLIGATASRSPGGVASQLQVEGTSYDTSSFSLIANTNSTVPPYISLGKSRGTSNGASTVVQDGDYLGLIQFCGTDGTDIASRAAEIFVQVDGAPGSNDLPGRLIFGTTADGAASPTERMRLDKSGGLQIGSQTKPGGNTSQYSILSLLGNSLNANASILTMCNRVNTSSTSNNDNLGYIIFGDQQAGEYGWIRGAVDAAPASGDYPGRIEFATTPDGSSAPVERMRIENDGDFRFSSGAAGTNYGGLRGWSTTTGDMIIDADKSATGSGGSNLIIKSRGTEVARWASSGIGSCKHFASTDQGYGGTKNALINGNMEICQRKPYNTNHTGITGNAIVCDRWELVANSNGTWSMKQGATTAAGGPRTHGHGRTLSATVTSDNGSIAASEYAFVRQKIAGRDLKQFCSGGSEANGSKKFALSFWVYNENAGNYTVELVDNDNTKKVSAQYNVASANTWEFKTLIFPHRSQSFTWDDNWSLAIMFWLGAGGNYKGGTYNTSWYNASANTRVNSDMPNVAGTTDGDFRLTGVQLEPGDVCTSYDTEDWNANLSRCQRYYEKSYEWNTPPGTSTLNGATMVRYGGGDVTNWPGIRMDYRTPKRAAGTVTFYSLNGTSGAVSDCGNGMSHSSNKTVNQLQGKSNNGVAGCSVDTAFDEVCGFQWTCDAEF